MPLKSAKTFKEEEYWANLYGETIATPTAPLPPATPEPEPEEEMGNFNRGLNMAVEEAQGLAGGVKALVGSSIGNDEWVDSGMEIYQRNMAEAEQYAGDVQKIEDIDWDAGEAGKWLAHTAGRFLPDIGMAVVSGGIGGAVTKKVVKEGIKNKVNDQAQDIVQAGIEKDAADYIARMFAEKEAADAVGKAAFRGSVAGAAAYTGQQSAGGSFARILEETGVEAPLTALGVGAASGFLEAAPFMRVFSSMFPKGKAKEFGEFIAGDLATRPPWITSALKDIGNTMGINAVTDATQLILDDSAVTYVNNNFSENEAQEYANYLMDPEDRSRMGNTLAVSTFMGLTMGVGTATFKGARGDYRNPQFDDQANQTRTESNNNPSQRQEILRIFNEHRNKAKSLTGGPAPFDPVSGKKATVWDGNGALNPETNQPYTPEDYTQAGVPLPPRPLDVEGDAGFLAENEPLTPEQRQEAGLSELTDYDGKDINVPQDIPEGTDPAPVVPESAPVVEASQQPMFAEDSLPPSPEAPQAPQADIVTDFAPANPEFGTTEVPARSTESGTVYEYHNFEGQLSDPAKPVADQLVELSVAASTPEALDPANTDVVVEAIDVDDVDRIFDRNDSQIVETKDKPTGKSLPTIGESFGENAQEATDLVAGVMADLSASGVPKSFLDSVTGMYVHTSSDHDVPAMTGQNKRGISLNSSLVSGSVSDPKQLSELAWSMTHEVYHAADFAMGLSDKDAQFNITIDESAQTPNVVMGDVMQELFTNWAEGTDLGRRFDYPFNDLREEISDRDKNNAGLNQTYRQEVFAQLGAMFHSNPKLLQEQSPLAYNYIKGIRDSNLQQPQTQESPDEISGSPVQADTSQPEGISGQVRAPPESGSVESAPVADTGSDGEGSTGVGRTDSTVEGQAQEEAGQRQRPAVQEPDVEVPTTVPTVEPIAEATPERQEVAIKLSDKKPTFKKAENWEDTGTLTVTFADGDRYQVYFDEDASEGRDSGDDDVYYQSIDGKVADADLGTTKKESIQAIIDHREKLFAAGENSYNTPLEAQVGSDTYSKGYDLITDSPEGKLKLTDLRKKFKKLDDNQFDNLVEQLLDSEPDGFGTPKDPEDMFEIDGEFIVNPEKVKYVEEERVAEERMIAEESDFDSFDFDDTSFIQSYSPPKKSKSGKYIGSPAGMNTPAKLSRLRKFVKALALDGEYGRFWYERSGATILDIAGKDVGEAKKIVQAIAITSPSTPVDTNYEYAIQAYYQWKNGKPIETGRFPETMGKKITDVFEGKTWSGRKTNNFEQNLLRSIDESVEQGVTTDLWMMRAFGYTSDDATDLNYNFVENETQKIAEDLGWEPQQVQAAIWVEIKARMESTSVKKEVDMKSEMQGNYTWQEKRGKKVRVFKNLKGEQAHSQLWVKTALNYKPTEKERSAAKFDYKDATLNKMAQISVESIPSTKSGHLPEIFNASEGEILDFHHSISKAFMDDNGVDIVAKELGILQYGSSQGMGSWEGRNDPVTQNEIVIPRRYRERADGVVSDDANDLVAAYAAVKGILLKQDGIGWHRPFFKKSNTAISQNGMDVNIGRPFSLRETQEISQLLSEYGLEPLSTGTGVRFINFNDGEFSGLPNFKAGKSNLDFKDAIINALGSVEFDGGESYSAKSFISANDLLENDWTENKNGEGYLGGRLEGRPDLQRRVSGLVSKLQPRVREVEAEFSGRYGWKRNEELNQVYNTEAEVDAPPDEISYIQKKKNNAKNNTLDDGSPSTSQFSFKDEIDGQSDLRRRFNKGRNPTVRSLSDRYDTLKQLEDQAADYLEVGRIPASMSPRDQENLSHGKVQDDLDEFHKTYVDVIGDLIHKSKIDPESIGVYLLAKHAQERNANVFEKEKAQREKNIARTKKEIQKLEDDVEVDHTVAIATQKERLSLYETMPFKFEDSGSGMTNGEAQSVLNTAEREGTKGQMEEIASKVYEMLQFQRDRMVKAGLLDEVSKADWEDTFKFYVPLKGFAAEENGDTYVRGSTSRGFSIVGSESMKAKGRKTLPVNPLLTAIEDVQKKIIRARKNETAQTLLDLLSNLGTSDSYVIYNNKFRPPMESDPLTMQDLKSMSRDRRPNGDPKYVEVKKGGQTFFIYFKSDSLNHSLQNMSVPLLSRANESIGKVLTFATRFQTFRRNMLINYNPSWGLVNPIRDVQTALMYGLSEMDKKGSRTKGKNIVGAMAKTYLPAMRSLYRYYREKPVREGNEIDQYTQEFHDDGAQTGLMLVRDQAEQLRILKSKLKKGYTRDSIRSLLKFVEDFNTTMENSVRLSSYIEARKAGAPREDAATLAKDLTVNFNRKGEDSATVNALYLFFNAAVQGNVNIMQALGNDGSSGKRFTTAQKTAAGLVALGSSLALMNILNSEDDDDGDKKYEDLPEHAKNRSLLIMGLDGEEGFALPAPYGYNFFTNIGRYGTELAMGVTEIEDVAVNLADNILLNFVPITPSAGDSWAEKMRGFYPDLLEIHLDLVANKDFFGRDIAVEQNPLFVKRSQSYVAKRGTGKNFKEITKFMNDATGGDEFEDGLMSFSPDRMQYAYSYFFGGLGRSASQSGDVMSLMMADQEVRKQDMPVVSTFFKRPSENEDRFEYYDNWEEVRQMKTQITQTTDPQELESLYKRFKPFVTVMAGESMPVLQGKGIPNLYDLANKDLIKIRKSRKLVENQNYGAGVLGEEKRKQVLDELDKNENLIFDLFNKAYRKAEKKAKG